MQLKRPHRIPLLIHAEPVAWKSFLPVDGNHKESRSRCPAGQFLIVRSSKNSAVKAQGDDLRIEEE